MAEGQPGRTPITTDDLAIKVTGASQQVVYSNRAGGVYYSETSGENTSALEGFYVNGIKMMDDYVIYVNKRPLLKSEIVSTVVYPHQMIRTYHDGTKETITLADFSNVLLIELDSVRGKEIRVRPYFKDVRDTSELMMRVQFGELYIGRRNTEVLSVDDFPKIWLGVVLAPGPNFSYVFYEQTSDDHGYSPALMQSSVPSNSFLVEFFVSENPKGLVDLSMNALRNFPDSVYDRRVRMDQMMMRSYLRTDNAEINRALNWAKISFDALIVDGNRAGIRSGVPHGDRFEAREVFSSMRGAYHFLGDFPEARPIFRDFAETQDTNSSSPTYGCIADGISGELSFRMADATPLFVSALGEYIQRFGDSSFAAEMFPTVERAIIGTLRNRVDNRMFLMHGERDTWMNIPRGNRANDLQALWYEELKSGADLARYLYPGSGKNETIAQWVGAATSLKASFQKYFLDSVQSRVYDHLDAEGEPDAEVLPNELYVSDLIADPRLAQGIFADATLVLVSRYGVATSSPGNSLYYPYHYNSSFYSPREGMYHGVVWPWLAGEWMKQAARLGFPDTAMVVSTTISNMILHGSLLGSIPQMVDALPMPGGKSRKESGLSSYSRSLAEYLRGWYEGFLGVKVDRMGSRIQLHPNLPSSIKTVDFNVLAGSSVVQVKYIQAKDHLDIDITAPASGPLIDLVLKSPLTLGTRSAAENEIILHQAEFALFMGSHVSLAIGKDGIHANKGYDVPSLKVTKTAVEINTAVRKNLSLATLPVDFSSRNLAPQKVRLLSLNEVKKPDVGSKLLYDAADPSGDELSAAQKSYPAIAGLKAGYLDVTHLTVSADTANVFFKLKFRDLGYSVDHPERGYDLTMAALCIDNNQKSEARSSTVGENAGFSFDRFSYSEIIYLGNGLRVEDAKGQLLAEYFPVPDDEKSPLGDFSARTITFSLPARIIGRPDTTWRYAVVTGVKDDSMDEIGMFRTIGNQSTKDLKNGQNTGTRNIFDVLLPSANGNE